jgi:hypothetical protein
MTFAKAQMMQRRPKVSQNEIPNSGVCNVAATINATQGIVVIAQQCRRQRGKQRQNGPRHVFSIDASRRLQ